MAKRKFDSVDECIAAQPEEVRSCLERVRRAIHNAIADVEEVISYDMPTYRLEGKRVLYFAAWKCHYAIYAATKTVLAAFGDELAPYEVRTGTIRFALTEPVPVRLIERIARFRAKEVAQ
jgi:uncharacterized protein YdhG (YjbR/CyaY superfamily)